MGGCHHLDSPSHLEGPRPGPAGFVPISLGGGGCCHTRKPGGRYGQRDAHVAPVAWSCTAAVALLGIFDLGSHAAVFAANIFPASFVAITARQGAAGGRSSRVFLARPPA